MSLEDKQEQAAKQALICAYHVNGEQIQALTWEDVCAGAGSRDSVPEQGYVWLHLDRTFPETAAWLQQRSGLEPLAHEALLESETRPRSWGIDDGMVVILRGVNLNPGDDPDDMVSVRVWVEPGRVITIRRKPAMAIRAIRDAIESGKAPKTSGEFFLQIVAGLTDRVSPVIEDLDDTVDGLEDDLLVRENREIRSSLRDLRRQAIGLRRYLSPQREALNRILGEEPSWLTPRQRARLRELGDRVLRYVEDLDEVRERAAVIQDELMNRISEQMNRTMYVLSVVSATMLPLGVVTGLLGINVGGIPGADSPFGFGVVCTMLVGLVALQVWIFRRLHWI